MKEISAASPDDERRALETRQRVEEQFKSTWACLTCFAKFPMGKLRTGGGVGERSPGNDHGLNCPECRSMKIHPADSTFDRVPPC